MRGEVLDYADSFLSKRKNNPQSTASINDDNDKIPKRKIKDSIFRHLFLEPEYALQLYRILHPEDTTATEADISYLTITKEITNGIRNDLGMYIGGKFLIMIEAQTTWSENIVIRIFIYLAEIWKNYIVQNGLDVFSSKDLNLPIPELYVVYTGEHKSRPAVLKLSEHIFHGTCKDVELTVHMIYNGKKEKDILSQYISFTKQVKYFFQKYGRTSKAAEELFRYCIDHNILKEYLLSRQEEVTSMLDVIFDDTIHRRKQQEEAFAAGEARGEARGRKAGRAEGEMRKARETAVEMARIGIEEDVIAGVLKVDVSQVKEWLT